MKCTEYMYVPTFTGLGLLTVMILLAASSLLRRPNSRASVARSDWVEVGGRVKK